MRYVRQQIVTGYAALKDFASPDMSPRMFFLDFYVYPPVILVCLFFAFDHSGWEQWVKSTALIVSGITVTGITVDYGDSAFYYSTKLAPLFRTPPCAKSPRSGSDIITVTLHLI